MVRSRLWKVFSEVQTMTSCPCYLYKLGYENVTLVAMYIRLHFFFGAILNTESINHSF